MTEHQSGEEGAEGLSEAEREQVALACDAMFDFGDTWIRFLRNGNETALLPVVERILADRLAAVVAERHTVHVTTEPVAEDVVWCDDCNEWVTAGAPERREHSPGETCVEADERAADNWRRAESAEVENARLRARLAEVEALADEWDADLRRETGMADDYSRRALRAALAGPSSHAQRDAEVGARVLLKILDPNGEGRGMVCARLLDAADRMENPSHKGNQFRWPEHVRMFRDLADALAAEAGGE